MVRLWLLLCPFFFKLFSRYFISGYGQAQDVLLKEIGYKREKYIGLQEAAMYTWKAWTGSNTLPYILPKPKKQQPITRHDTQYSNNEAYSSFQTWEISLHKGITLQMPPSFASYTMSFLLPIAYIKFIPDICPFKMSNQLLPFVLQAYELFIILLFLHSFCMLYFFSFFRFFSFPS